MRCRYDVACRMGSKVSSNLKFFLNNSYCRHTNTVWKVSKYGVLSGPYFPVFGLNTEFYSVNLRIQSKYGKIGTRKNSEFGHFSHSVIELWNSRNANDMNFIIQCTNYISKFQEDHKLYKIMPVCPSVCNSLFFRTVK